MALVEVRDRQYPLIITSIGTGRTGSGTLWKGTYESGEASLQTKNNEEQMRGQVRLKE